MCRRKQTAQKQTWSSWEFKFFMFVFPTAAFIFCFHKKRLFAKFYSANVIHGSCIDDKYTQTLSSIKTHHNLICQKVLRKDKKIFFFSYICRSLTFCVSIRLTRRQKLNCSELIFSICDTFRAHLLKFWSS